MSIRAYSRVSLSAPQPTDEHIAQSVLLLGEGSEQTDASAEMIRLTAHLRDAGVAPHVVAGFMHYSRLTFTQSVAQCALSGATEVVVLPYVLTASHFIAEELPALVRAAASAHPGVRLRVAQPLGDHPALARLVLQRALEADYTAAHPYILGETQRRYIDNSPPWQPLHSAQRVGLLLVTAERSAAARRVVNAVAQRVRARAQYTPVVVSFSAPPHACVAEAIAAFAARGVAHAVVVPYTLHQGSVASVGLDLVLNNAREQHPTLNLLLAEHLGFDRLLVAAVGDRIAEALAVPVPETLALPHVS